MKKIAIILNILFLLFIGYMSATEGTPKGANNFFILIFLIGIPIINLIALREGQDNNEGWLGLFLKRKALEEKRKIEEINSKKV